MFYIMNKPEWRKQENIEFITQTELRIAQFFDKYRQNWLECDMKTALALSNDLRAKKISEGMLLEEISIKEWLSNLDAIYKRVA